MNCDVCGKYLPDMEDRSQPFIADDGRVVKPLGQRTLCGDCAKTDPVASGVLRRIAEDIDWRALRQWKRTLDE